MSECEITPDDENRIDVDADDQPVYIEVTVPAPKAPARASICRTWDRCKHLRSDEFNEQFLEDHPECR